MTTYLRVSLVAFILGWVLSSAGYGQCIGRACPPRPWGGGVRVSVGVGVGSPVAPLVLAAPLPIRDSGQNSTVTIIRPVYRPGTRIILKPTRRHLRWLD